MKCAIIQPSYIPWRGYFEQIYKADIFVFYDDVQYDKHGWRNRNRIKTHQGAQWLTIPVHSGGVVVEHIPINQIEIDWHTAWNRKHWSAIQQAYSKATYFEKYEPMLKHFYFEMTPALLADFTIETTMILCRELGMTRTQFIRSSAIQVSGRKTERVIDVLTQLGVTEYISGPSARSYIEEDKFNAAGISLEYMQYEYEEYPQLYPPYDPQISILDLMMMTGAEALNYIKHE
ncbi:MAG: WbqC family protein [Chloroflexota bacterium]